MQTQDFYKLGRPVQDRLIGCVNGTGLPAPFLSVRGAPLEPFVWLLGAGACGLALLALYRLGLGSLDNPLSVHRAPFIGAYFVVVALLVFTLVRAAGLIVEARSLPFKPGIYAFPIGVIDARRYTLKIYPIDDLVSSQGPDPNHGFKLSFRGGDSFEFRAKNAEAAAKAAETIAGARGQLAAAEQAPGSMRPNAIASLDPLQGFVNPLAPTTSIARSVPVWVKFAWAIAPGMGLVLGVCLWLVRNVVSDDKMFEFAKTEDTAPRYRAYLARGSRHRSEVEVVLLPRAELREAKAKGTVDAMEAYIALHPKTGIPTEIQEALRSAMVKELDDAKKAGTVTALKDFAAKHPNHHMEADLRVAIHGVYVAAFDHYKREDAPKETAPTVFVERLLGWAEAKGSPKVEVRFHRRTSRSLERADSMISKNRYFMGMVSLPSKYQDVQHMKPREEETAKKLIERFNKAFPSDVLALEMGQSIDDPEGPLPPITTPTWFIEHNAEWDGGARTSDRPRGVWCGIGYTFETIFRLPDESAKPLKFKAVIWRAPSTQDLEPDERPEEKIYTQEASQAFEQLAKRLAGTLFAD